MTLRIPSIGGGLRTGVNPVLIVVALRRERGVVLSTCLLGKLSEVKTWGGTVSHASKSSGARLFFPIETAGSASGVTCSTWRGMSTLDVLTMVLPAFGSGVLARVDAFTTLGRDPDASALEVGLGRDTEGVRDVVRGREVGGCRETGGTA